MSRILRELHRDSQMTHIICAKERTIGVYKRKLLIEKNQLCATKSISYVSSNPLRLRCFKLIVMLRRHILFAFFLVLVSAKMMQGQFPFNVIDPLREIGGHSRDIISHTVDATLKARNYFNENAAPRLYDMFHSIANPGSYMPQLSASSDKTKPDAGDTGIAISYGDDLEDTSKTKGDDVSPLSTPPAAQE